MATRISDLTALPSGLKKNDKFELCKTDEGKSYSCTPEDILNYCKDESNGAFKKTTAESLDNLTKDYIGVWLWTGSGGPNGLTSGILEVISCKPADEQTTSDMDIIQRLTDGPYVYQRHISGTRWSEWISLANKNGCRILYGEGTCTDGIAHVSFNPEFASTPYVTATPINNSNDEVYILNIRNITANGFDAIMKKSDLLAAFETETIATFTDPTTQATVKQTDVVSSRGAWTNGNGTFSWIATLEEG